MIGAPMAVAAQIYNNGSTLHTLLHINDDIKNKLMPLEGNRKIKIENRIQNCKLLIIDEISAITIGLLSQANKRFQTILENNEYFGNINAILLIIGDFRQLNPGQSKSLLSHIIYTQTDF